MAAERNGPVHLPGRVFELTQLVISSCFFCHDSHLGQWRGHSSVKTLMRLRSGLIRAGSGALLSGGEPEQRKGRIQSGGDDLETYF